MTGILIKKQLAEVFRGYFYSSRKNKMRSKSAVVTLFVLYGLLLIGFIGGVFTVLSLAMCETMVPLSLGYLYFLIMSGISVLLGTFGSVFSTYSSLYHPKDNDLLLSMPIPVRCILTSRLVNVYLPGLMYSGVVIVPAVAVYIVTAGLTLPRLACGAALIVIISLIVAVLSCLLGLCVARISLRLKNKSLITVIISLAFLAAYYFFCFNSDGIVEALIANAAGLGERLRGSSQALYMFGRVGEGDVRATLVYLACTAVLTGVTWLLLSRSFLTITTSTGAVGSKPSRVKKYHPRSQFAALLAKEFSRFTSSANYMLNCALGTVMIPAGGVMLLVKGGDLLGMIMPILGKYSGAVYVLLAAAVCFMVSLNDTAAPSMSLEGKTMWIVRALPVDARLLIKAKISLHLILTVLPTLFTCVCACIVVKGTIAEMIILCLVPVTYCALSAVFDMYLGIRLVNLSWTNESRITKQSAGVTIAMFAGWLYSGAAGAIYFLFAPRLGCVPYLAIVACINCALCALVYAHIMSTANKRLAEM